MESTPFLLVEDQLDYARVLEELLHNEQVRSALRRSPTGPGPERLQALALRDAADIAKAAASEYSYFVSLREQSRRSDPVPDRERLGGDDPAQWQAPRGNLRAAERAGWAPLITVLLPILSGLSSVVLILLGYALRAEDSTMGQPLLTAGVVAGVICGVSMLVAIVGLLLTAARDASTPPDDRNPELYAELAKARETWHGALRDRGMLPYLLAELGTVPRPPGPRPSSTRPAGPRVVAPKVVGVSLVRVRPKLGYTSPGFTSPAAERITGERGEELEQVEPESHFSSPGYTSPGSERISDERGKEQEPDSEPHYTSPGFSSPDFASPDFEVPKPPPPSTAVVPEPRRRIASRFLPNADDVRAQEGADVEE